MTRDHALELLKKYVKSENMIKHCLASEAVMKAMAFKLGEDADKWSLAGLLHDIDVELTANDIEQHGLKARAILEENNISQDIIESIKMHNEAASREKRKEIFHKALAASETITGLITATALVYPDKKLQSVKISSILKRMKDKRFAASVDRNIILECEDIKIPIAEFAQISLDAMKGISDNLGL